MIRLSPDFRHFTRDFPVRLRAFLLSCGLSLGASAQEMATNLNSLTDARPVVATVADAAWQNLQAARNAASQDANVGSSNGAARVQALAQRSGREKQVADQAKAFYTANPTHAAAGEARNVEIFSLIQAVEDGDGTVSDRLAQAAAQLRANPAIPVATRARGVAANEFTQAARGAANEDARRQAIATVARNLMREFPTEPQGYEALWALARSAAREQAVALSAELAASNAPQSIRQAAQLLLDRQTLVNRSLAEILGPDGTSLLAKLPAGTPVAIYSWATWGPGSLDLGRMIQARRFAAIAVCIDENVAEATKQSAAAGLGGVPVYDTKGLAGTLASRLKFGASGQLYLVDAAGIIRDVRGAEDLESKLNVLGFRTPEILPPQSPKS